ncbi:hypothetical protein TNCV_22341 [Trichonephila clavipes]|nr:hypothetical protein TNCV_22341 [Trichonephila clavipes]
MRKSVRERMRKRVRERMRKSVTERMRKRVTERTRKRVTERTRKRVTERTRKRNPSKIVQTLKDPCESRLGNAVVGHPRVTRNFEPRSSEENIRVGRA